MYDRLRWGNNVIYGPNTLEVHFKTDDECIDIFCEHARQLNCKIVVCQISQREGLTVFVMNVDGTTLHALLLGEDFNASQSNQSFGNR